MEKHNRSEVIVEPERRAGFLHSSEQTVTEQIIYRLRSQRWPVRLFDIVDGKAIERDALKLRGKNVTPVHLVWSQQQIYIVPEKPLLFLHIRQKNGNQIVEASSFSSRPPGLGFSHSRKYQGKR